MKYLLQLNKFQFPSPTLSLYMYLFAQTKNDLLCKTFMLLPSRVVTSTYILNSTVTHNAMQHLFIVFLAMIEKLGICVACPYLYDSLSEYQEWCVVMWLPYAKHQCLAAFSTYMITEYWLSHGDWHFDKESWISLNINKICNCYLLTFKTCWFVHEGEDFYWRKIACPMEL